MQLDRIRKAQSRINLVLHIPRPELDPMRYHFMDWAGNSKIGYRRQGNFEPFPIFVFREIPLIANLEGTNLPAL
jgi:hypothetical protein